MADSESVEATINEEVWHRLATDAICASELRAAPPILSLVLWATGRNSPTRAAPAHTLAY